MPQFGGTTEKCSVCDKTVYVNEKIVVEDKDDRKTYHKTCLKCTHCKATLSLGNYASMNGVMYCKPHFKQLFATKGNYDEGFGKDKLTAKWSGNPGSPAPTTAGGGSFVPVDKGDDAKPTEKKETPSAISSKFSKASEKCEKCEKSVYATEKIVVEEKDEKKVYHKNCLRCTHCQVVLTLGSYAAMNGVTYCKPHLKQLFAAKGNYDEGFGGEKHTAKWNPQGSPAPTTFVPVEKSEIQKDNKPSTPNEVANKFKSMSASDKCSSCGKTVYLTEKVVVEDKEDKKIFHKACLRCSHCQVVLSLGNYASMNGVMYCKPHFKQLFATKGNYDEGFGKEKHSAKWIEGDKEEKDDRSKSPERDAEDRPSEHTHTHQEGEHEHSHEGHKHTDEGHEHSHEGHEHSHEGHEHSHEGHEHSHDDHEHSHEGHEHHEHSHEEHSHSHEGHEHEHSHDDHEHHEHEHEEREHHDE